MVFDVLIVEDDPDVSSSISTIMEDEGFSCVTAAGSAQVMDIFKRDRPRVMLVDILLMDSKHSGLEIMEIIKKKHPDIPCIVMSGHASVNPDEMRKHAHDYIQKPFRAHQIVATIRNAISHAQLSQEHESLLQSMNQDIQMAFNSPQWQAIKVKVRKVAATNGRVLILGSKGSGRELVARNIHALSSLSDREFICFSPTLFRSEEVELKLCSEKSGYLHKAREATLFISEVEHLPERVQEMCAYLLSGQVLQNDSNSFRLITSASRDLPRMVEEGKFREDLYNRINSIQIDVPDLRESKSDIPRLCKHMIQSVAASNGMKPLPFSKGAVSLIENYDWPGNLKQLKNILEYALISCFISGDKVITEDKIPLNEKKKEGNLDSYFLSLPIKKARELFEKNYIEKQLDRSNRSVSYAAKFMGMERTALYRKLKDLRISISKS